MALAYPESGATGYPAGNYIIGAGAPTVTSAQGSIPQMLGFQEKELEHLGQRIATLCQRLETGGLLRPAMPTPSESQRAAERAAQSSLAQTIQTHTMRMGSAAGQIQDVLDRLDI